MFVKPREGLLVRHPAHMRQLPPDGANVDASPYWTRRLRDGDVVEIIPGTAEPTGADADSQPAAIPVPVQE